MIREKLVACLTNESVIDVRKKIGDAVAEVARQYTDNGMWLRFSLSVVHLLMIKSGILPGDQWPEILGVLFQASQSTESGLRETAFRIFTTTPGIIEKQHEDAVIGVFSKGFKDDNISVGFPSA